MTYSIRIRVRDDGGVECEPSYGIPPGEFDIDGNDDGNRVRIAIRQRDPRGRFVIRASHERDRAEEMLHAAEEAAEAIAEAEAGTERF